jgi:3-methyladenine DNA glycosylase AlkD
MNVATLRQRLRAHASAKDAAILQWFFKTGPGEYGEGDVFIGVRVPAMRRVCRECGDDVSVATVEQLLRSQVHEDRALALMLLVSAFGRGDEREQKAIYDRYLANTRYINNWDLVDLSAPSIVGGWLSARSRAPLRRLARSASLWERRIAIVATQAFIRRDEFEDTLEIADLLIHDEHDLIHKAVGWMLREVGKRDGVVLRTWLRPRHTHMPRTMLRYAIERFPESERRRYLKGLV